MCTWIMLFPSLAKYCLNQLQITRFACETQLELNKQEITLSIIEKVTPCWSWNLVFASMAPCLFSSQVPLPFLSDGILKFVEVHQEFLKHEWLQDIKLGDSNRLTTWPLSRLFSRVVKNAEREGVESSLAAKTAIFTIPWNRTMNKTFLASIAERKSARNGKTS